MAALLISALLIAAAYAGALLVQPAPAWTAWAIMIGTSTIMLAMTVLGAARGKRGVGRLAVPLASMFVVLLVGFGAALMMPAEDAGSPLWFGLPPRAAVILYGVGILPLFVLPIAYAMTFETMTLDEADLERVRQMKRSGGGT